MKQNRQSLKIHNRTSGATRLWIEPWGDFVEIAPSASIVVVAEGPLGSGLELSLKERESTLYGWSGATIRILSDGGDELWTSPIPSL